MFWRIKLALLKNFVVGNLPHRFSADVYEFYTCWCGFGIELFVSRRLGDRYYFFAETLNLPKLVV